MHPAAPRALDSHHSAPTLVRKPYIKAALLVAHTTTQVPTTIDDDDTWPAPTMPAAAPHARFILSRP